MSGEVDLPLLVGALCFAVVLLVGGVGLCVLGGWWLIPGIPFAFSGLALCVLAYVARGRR